MKKGDKIRLDLTKMECLSMTEGKDFEISQKEGMYDLERAEEGRRERRGGRGGGRVDDRRGYVIMNHHHHASILLISRIRTR